MQARPGGPVTAASPLEQRIAAHYAAGQTSVPKTARAFGVTESQVRDALAATGVEVRPQAHLYRAGPYEKQIVARARRGEPARQIGRTLGLSRDAVLRVMRRHGIDPLPQLRPRVLTPERMARAIALYDEGRTSKQIAELLGVHAVTVTRVLREHGQIIRGNRLPQQTAQQVAAAYAAGQPIARVAKRFGIAPETVLRVVDRCEVPRRPSRAARSAARAAEVARRRAAGESVRTIATALGMSDDMVYHYLRKARDAAGNTSSTGRVPASCEVVQDGAS